MKDKTRTALIKLAQAAGATQINFCHGALPSEPEATATSFCYICRAYYVDETGREPCPACEVHSSPFVFGVHWGDNDSPTIYVAERGLHGLMISENFFRGGKTS